MNKELTLEEAENIVDNIQNLANLKDLSFNIL